jgi:hypothetical protein
LEFINFLGNDTFLIKSRDFGRIGAFSTGGNNEKLYKTVLFLWRCFLAKPLTLTLALMHKAI